MAIRKLKTSTIKTGTWYKSMLAGNPAYIPAFEGTYLVVAGGGSGGNNVVGDGYPTGGGGAGGLLYATTAIPLGTPLTVTVGAGAAQNPTWNTYANANACIGITGSNSVFSSFTALGGGGGGPGGQNIGYGSGAARDGGSGGGGGSNNGVRGNGTAGQGYNGGAGGDYPGTGGGGGAGAVGAIRMGGVGRQITEFATATSSGVDGGYYAGGGTGGGGGSPWDRVGGGAGGGGAGGAQVGGLQGGTNGVANTGGGGGGAYGQVGGAGGSGIVIIKYPTSVTMSGGAGLTLTTYTSGGFKYTKFTAGTGSVTFV